MRSISYLQFFRRRANVSQTALAEQLGGGINRFTISGWETGLSMPLPETKKKIAKILKVEEKILFSVPNQ